MASCARQRPLLAAWQKRRVLVEGGLARPAVHVQAVQHHQSGPSPGRRLADAAFQGWKQFLPTVVLGRVGAVVHHRRTCRGGVGLGTVGDVGLPPAEARPGGPGGAAADEAHPDALGEQLLGEEGADLAGTEDDVQGRGDGVA